MRRAILALAAVPLLVGPTAVAFVSGGFSTHPRLIAGITVWGLVLVLTVLVSAPLPRTPPGWLALSGLVLITTWSAASVAWTPVRGEAAGNVERLLLYVGVLLVAIGVAREPVVRRYFEPALAAGTTIVICYGLSGRLLPGLIHVAHSLRAGGRLEQPITYWNAEGALAAVGFVLCARIAGDASRSRLVRSLAAAASAPLGAGVYLSYSRGAIAAGGVGVLLVVAAVPLRSQLRAAVVTVAAGIAAAACSSAFPGVASLGGGLGARERDGGIMLAILVLLAVAAALLVARDEADMRESRLPGARQRLAVVALVIALVSAGLVVRGLQQKLSASDLSRANPSRLTSVSSNRYNYWRIAGRAFVRHPLDGLGSGGFRIYWLRERPIAESVQQAHSIELEMAAELGVVGLLAFAMMVGGVAWAALRALRGHPALVAGWAAGALVWLLHASIDWDWELPAVTLPAITLAGALIAAAESTATREQRPI
jgi:O-Antigen ligase